MELIFVLFVVLFLVLIFLKSVKSSPIELSYIKRGALFTPAERSFLGVLQQALPDGYIIFGKVRVADVLTPEKGQSRNNWQSAFNKISAKHFDYVLCDKDDLKVIAAIELDDKSHNSKKSKARDSFLEATCKNAELTLVRFPAQRNYQISYVQDKIKQAIEPQTVEVAA